MEIEKLYNDLIHTARAFTNSINRNDVNEKKMVTSTLSDIINRIVFTMKDDSDCKDIENRLVREFRKLSKEMFVKTNNKVLYLKKMQRNIDYLTWVNKARAINLGTRKYMVADCPCYNASKQNKMG